MKKIIMTIIVLIFISGCATNPETEKLVEKLNNNIIELENKLSAQEENIIQINAENTHLIQAFDGYDYNDTQVNFKEILEVRATVIKKQKGDDLYPYYLLVTLEDRDHNTPLLLTVENKDTFDAYKENESYDLKIFVTLVVDKKINNIRFMYILHDSVESSVYKTTVIPDKMEASSIIEFISDSTFIVKKGNIVDGYDQDVFEGLPESHERYPAPKKGMIVLYADDGYILRINEE